jgi:microcystin degradation protein MlrC
MGLMDKVKEQAAAAAQAAKEAAAKGQAKVDEMQAKRAADGVLRQLGLAVYLQKTDRATAGAEGDIAGYLETLKAYEAEHGSLAGSTDSE